VDAELDRPPAVRAGRNVRRYRSPVSARHLALALCVVFSTAAGVASTPVARPVFHIRSPFSEIYVTEDAAKGRRCLLFALDGALQSCMALADPARLELAYTRSMVASLALAERPARALLIGLGGASIPRFLARHFPDTTLDVVEIDPEVVAVARRYFHFEAGPRARVHVAEGAAFLAGSRQTWDVILVDATLSDSVPPEMTTREFFAALETHLSPGGTAAMNLLAPAAGPATRAAMLAFDAAFPGAAVLLPEVTRLAHAGRMPGDLATPTVNHVLVGREGGATVACDAWRIAASRAGPGRAPTIDIPALVDRECAPLASVADEEAPR